jgi:hypothetical protein
VPLDASGLRGVLESDGEDEDLGCIAYLENGTLYSFVGMLRQLLAFLLSSKS